MVQAMPPIKPRPTFEAPSVKQLQSKLNDLQKIIKSSQAADGSLDLKAVERKAGSDPLFQLALKTVTDSFDRHNKPTFLDPSQTQTALSALLHAQTRLAAFDTNDDGKVNWDEGSGQILKPGLDNQIAGRMVGSIIREHWDVIGEWRGEVVSARHTIRDRGEVEEVLAKSAGFHAATQDGKAAVSWFLRDLVTQPGGVKNLPIREGGSEGDPPLSYRISHNLEKAESHPLVGKLFIGWLGTGKGHLTDDELRGFLKATDLKQFVADTQAAIKARVGGDYATHFLTGGDLPGNPNTPVE